MCLLETNFHLEIDHLKPARQQTLSALISVCIGRAIMHQIRRAKHRPLAVMLWKVALVIPLWAFADALLLSVPAKPPEIRADNENKWPGLCDLIARAAFINTSNKRVTPPSGAEWTRDIEAMKNFLLFLLSHLQHRSSPVFRCGEVVLQDWSEAAQQELCSVDWVIPFENIPSHI